MLRLETFGGLALTDSGGQQVVTQRRRLALLAMLAVPGSRGVGREKLIACFWSESTTDQARHALEQLVYSLRRQLPAGSLAGTDPLRLDPALVRTDVGEFTARLAEGDAGAAVALYGGPFLDGFFLTGASEFERWVERERERLDGEHVRALRALGKRAEGQGRETAEIDIRRQLAAADPLDERAAADLIRALAGADDWSAAARAAREYRARVHAELPGESTADLEAMVEGLRRERRSGGEGGARRYVVERELGRGTTATVYLARDRRFERPVALKVLRPDVASPTDARRFRREIEILARLYHPHILQLYDAGVLEPGDAPSGLYYVMPYVRGESLRQRLQREVQLPIADAVRIAANVADALAYAHGQGVIHRDIRPENILLEAGHALVADFGIAGVLGTAGGERLSATGVVLGVPAYSSPEQARGDKHLDGRSDIYSLGCVVYEMVGGEPPFTGATRTAVLARQIGDPVPPLRTLCPDLSADLDGAVRRALSKRPEERFATAAEFAVALRQA